MNNVIYIVSRPLVHSIAEAKLYATRKIEYKPSLRIECYSMPVMISQFIYDYQMGEWVEQVVTSSDSQNQRIK